MKVVLFCGGFGMRMRQKEGDPVPKPMQMVGPRPLIWHVMRYYAHYGHTEFVLCLGYGAEYIKDFFVNYEETTYEDLSLSPVDADVVSADVRDWDITFADTGIATPIGERLRRVRRYLDPGEPFLANYADVLTDASLDSMLETFRASGAAASLMTVPPQQSFHCVETGDDGRVSQIVSVSKLQLWENGGYFILTPEVFDHLPEGGDLVEDACNGLARQGRLIAQPYRGYWQPADTFKERAALDADWASGVRPWAVWVDGSRPDSRQNGQSQHGQFPAEPQHELR